ncbi:MAG: hypothetical protein COT73_00765 [Bdellovibrio sp. CG10_big_fil_rev_8_21_14_0_10_47_8]|nr:MAG: hypothetical protein COT73_00765 [Bdellovibrio sp. CG10_big_fil_rev_8_21_14_0_10_47_8]
MRTLSQGLFWILLVLSSAALGGLSSSLSTESLFVCNAGISHTDGESIAGSDSLVINYEDLGVPESSEARQRSNVLRVQFADAPKSQVAGGTELWLTQLGEIHFDLATEKYGTQYFIELCYRGPQKQMSEGPTPYDLSEGIYNLDLSVNIQESGGTGESYRSSASLQTSLETICDLRGRGARKNPRASDELGVSSVESDSWVISSPSSWNSSSLNFSVSLNDAFSAVPRFCRIRVSFQERATSALRNNALFPQEVNLFVNIQAD